MSLFSERQRHNKRRKMARRHATRDADRRSPFNDDLAMRYDEKLKRWVMLPGRSGVKSGKVKPPKGSLARQRMLAAKDQVYNAAKHK